MYVFPFSFVLFFFHFFINFHKIIHLRLCLRLFDFWLFCDFDDWFLPCFLYDILRYFFHFMVEFLIIFFDNFLNLSGTLYEVIKSWHPQKPLMFGRGIQLEHSVNWFDEKREIELFGTKFPHFLFVFWHRQKALSNIPKRD